MEIDTIRQTKVWFERAVPEPNSKNFHTQLGCHLEEVEEMLKPIRTYGGMTEALLIHAREALRDLSDHLKGTDKAVYIEDEDLAEYLDAICDQTVTGVGCAHMVGADPVGALKEVNRSNFSKFDEDGQPIFNENKKVMKGPGYSPPDLTDFLGT